MDGKLKECSSPALVCLKNLEGKLKSMGTAACIMKPDRFDLLIGDSSGAKDGGSMSERHVPVWNSLRRIWEPVDFHNRQRVVPWPADFDPGWLPVPEYEEGDRVQFVRDETCAREGVIHRILFERSLEELREDRERGACMADQIIYIVTARGHDHRIRASNILGRFVSPERISRVLPLQE